jgi:nickel-dependent lactate racemase
VKELEVGGINRSDMTVIIAGGAHRETTPDHLMKKIGPALLNELNILIHDCENNLLFLGKSKKGTPIHVNRTYAESDLKIGIGTILPHPIAGFSSGSKIAVPGVCGSETIRYLHDYIQCYQHDYHGGPGKRVGEPDNVFRKEIDAIRDIAGLDFLVNAVIDSQREILDLFAGGMERSLPKACGQLMPYSGSRPGKRTSS